MAVRAPAGGTRGGSPGAPGAPRAARAGFTLIELLVVLALVGLIAAAAVIGVGGIGRAKLQDQAFKLSRTSRAALIWALSRATTVRMLVDLDELTVVVEEADAPALVDDTGRLVEPDAGEDAGDEAGAGVDEQAAEYAAFDEEGLEGDDEGGFGLFGGLGGLGGFGFGGDTALDELTEPPRYRAPEFTPISDPRLRPFTLEGVSAMRVYLPGAEEPVVEGRVTILFRDDGTADEAVIHIEDDHGRVYAVALQALTGRGVIYPYPFVPEPPEILP